MKTLKDILFETELNEDGYFDVAEKELLQDLVLDMIDEIQKKNYDDIGGVIAYIKTRFNIEI